MQKMVLHNWWNSGSDPDTFLLVYYTYQLSTSMESKGEGGNVYSEVQKSQRYMFFQVPSTFWRS